MTTMRNTLENKGNSKKIGALLWTLQGLLAAFIAYGRLELLPHRERRTA